MQNLASVLVGIDFTPGSVCALRQAIRVAGWNRARVSALHVIDTVVAAELEAVLSPFQQKIAEGLIADARKAWVEFASKVEGAAGVPLDVRIDNRIRAMLAAATQAKADLMVVGARGERAPEVGVGTVASACVRHSTIPVLVVRPTQTGPFKSVVACVDFSPTSLIALDQAARVATQDGAALHVLHVFDPPWRNMYVRASTPADEPRFQQQYRETLGRHLDLFAGELGREIDYLKPVFAVVEGTAHRSGIVEYATKVGADLIVLGTRGRTNLRDVLLGSTAEKALRESTCSVLAVKPEGHAAAL